MKTEKNPKGAGRKQKYIEKTKTIAFRVPISFVEPLRAYVRKELISYEKPVISKDIDRAISENDVIELRDSLSEITSNVKKC